MQKLAQLGEAANDTMLQMFVGNLVADNIVDGIHNGPNLFQS
jgi:hypothetical protein